MTIAVSHSFDFEALPVRLEERTDYLFGTARILGDRRTWWIDSIKLDVDVPGQDGIILPPLLSNTIRLAPVRLKAGTQLFETIRFALHRWCTDQIDERMNRAVEEQGGYGALFREAMPRNPYERGYSRLNAPGRVFELTV